MQQNNILIPISTRGNKVEIFTAIAMKNFKKFFVKLKKKFL